MYSEIDRIKAQASTCPDRYPRLYSVEVIDVLEALKVLLNLVVTEYKLR